MYHTTLIIVGTHLANDFPIELQLGLSSISVADDTDTLSLPIVPQVRSIDGEVVTPATTSTAIGTDVYHWLRAPMRLTELAARLGVVGKVEQSRMQAT